MEHQNEGPKRVLSPDLNSIPGFRFGAVIGKLFLGYSESINRGSQSSDR